MISRRSFLQAGSTAALAVRGSARQLQNIGVQLYTVRSVMPQKAAETLKAIREIGYREVECTWAGLDEIWPSIQAAGLKPVSIHLDSKMVTLGSDDDLAKAVEETKRKGFSYAVFPYLPPAERGNLDVIKKLAGKLNRAGEKFHAAGVTFAYHNHAFEFDPKEGQIPFHVMLENTDPKLVGFELDLFWVSVAGQDPVEMLQHLKGRVPLVHLKDKATGTEVRYNESVPKPTFKEVGNGVIDWPAALKAAAAAGVEHYFVEQDQTPGDPVDSLRQSFGFVSKVNF